MRATRTTIVTALFALAALLIPVAAYLFDEPYLLTLFSRVLIYGLAAASLDLLIGYGGLVSFGHAAFFGAGAYSVGILAYQADEGSALISWPIEILGTNSALVAWPVAVLVAALLGVVIGALSLRTRGIHFIMITLAFAQMLFFVFVSLERYGGDDGLSMNQRNTFAGLDLANDNLFYYVSLGLLALFLFLALRLTRSRFGLLIQASKQNDHRLRALGFPLFRYQLACFVLGAAGAGLAGALIANQTEFVSPGLMHWSRSGELLVMVILGGIGTLTGPVLGAAALLLLEEGISAYTEHWMLYLGPILILVVLFARRGLHGALCGVRDREP